MSPFGNGQSCEAKYEYFQDGQSNDEANSPSTDEFSEAPEPISHTKQRLETLKASTKEKSRHVLQSLSLSFTGEASTTHHQPSKDLIADPAFNPSLIGAENKASTDSTADKVLGTLKAAGKAMIHPKTTAKRKAASKIAVTDQPYLSQQADDDYIDAHADLKRQSYGAAVHSSDDNDVADNIQKSTLRINQLKENRTARMVAWTTSTHMQRVATVVNPPLSPPDRCLFVGPDPKSGKPTFSRMAYGYALNRYYLKSIAVNSMGNVDLVPLQEFDQDVCIRYMERILIATSPWQSWFSSVRQIYRWEHPKKTAKWAAIWFFIWYIDYVMTFIFGWTVFIVLNNRFRQNRLEQLRDSESRIKNESRTAFRLEELIKRHGSSDWLDPLIEAVGPAAQMQLSDLADVLEIMTNFYEWRYPGKTWLTLFWFGCTILLGALTPTGYTMKILWMFCLLSVFLGRPIASLHPQYRHVVNALRWVFWDIPTDAEWSMMHLRQKAQETRSKLLSEQIEEKYGRHRDVVEDDSDCSAVDSRRIHSRSPMLRRKSNSSFVSAETDLIETLPPDQSIFDFKTRYKSARCRLLLHPWGICVASASPLQIHRKTLIEIHWHELREIRKATFSGRGPGKLLSSNGLELVIARDPRLKANCDADYSGESSSSESDGNGSNRHVVRLKALADRDQVFNLLIGFSGLKFQVLPPLPSEGSARDRGQVMNHSGQACINMSSSAEINSRHLAAEADPVAVPDEPFR